MCTNDMGIYKIPEGALYSREHYFQACIVTKYANKYIHT
jgi:hypothetical protein